MYSIVTEIALRGVLNNAFRKQKKLVVQHVEKLKLDLRSWPGGYITDRFSNNNIYENATHLKLYFVLHTT